MMDVVMNIDERPQDICMKLQAANRNLTKKVAPAACLPRSMTERDREAKKQSR